MKIALLSLKLSNFKGRNFEFFTNGGNTSFYGDNETGKTSLFDAYSWLMTGKDSLDRTETSFSIKPLDELGVPVPMVDVSVSATLEISDESGAAYNMVFEKKYSEIWTKKKGSAEKSFGGHETECFIDGRPLAAKDFSAKLGALIPDNLFKLLSNPFFFSSTLDWKKRRTVLLEICGDVTKYDVFAIEPSLQTLEADMERKTVDEIKATANASKTKINDRLKEIPARVDELKMTLTKIEDKEDDLEEQILVLEKQKTDVFNEKMALDTRVAVVNAKKAITELETRLARLSGKQSESRRVSLSAERTKFDTVSRELENTKMRLQTAKTYAEELAKSAVDETVRADKLRKQYHDLKDLALVPDVECICPTCKQSIPEDQVEEIKNRAISAFNEKKATDLADLIKRGKAATAGVTDAKERSERRRLEYEELLTKIFELEVSVNNQKVAVQNVENANFKGYLPEDEVEWHAIMQEIAAKSEIVKATDECVLIKKVECDSEIGRIMQEVSVLSRKVSSIHANHKAEERISELLKEQKQIASDYEQLEKKVMLCDLYTTTMVGMLEEKVASKFKLVRFKLFNAQVNGGISECCDATVNGVPFGSVNHGGQVKAGLDIISTLSEYHNKFIPVWIDNNESVTKIPLMASQVISLYVSEKDKSLRQEGGRA